MKDQKCMTHQSMEGHSCAAELPASVPDTRFCSPEKCQYKIPTKRFSSPNSSLSKEELEQLKQFIEHINGILRVLSNPRDPNNLSALRVHFKKLKGIIVKVVYDCDNSKASVEGLLRNAGRDFLTIEVVGQSYYIPYMRICKVESNPCAEQEVEHGTHQDLMNIDPCLRREIVLNFGDVVARSPELINAFFGIPLYLELAKFIGCYIEIRVSGQAEVIRGFLIGSTVDKVCIEVDNIVQEINLADICIVIKS